MNINTYVGVRNLKQFFFSAKNIKIFIGIKFSRLADFEYFLKPFFCPNPPKIKVYRVFNLSISLMTLIVPLFWVSAVTTLRAQIGGSAIFHWTYSQEIYYNNFTHGHILFSFCHLTSCDQVFGGTCGFMGVFNSP